MLLTLTPALLSQISSMKFYYLIRKINVNSIVWDKKAKPGAYTMVNSKIERKGYIGSTNVQVIKRDEKTEKQVGKLAHIPSQ